MKKFIPLVSLLFSLQAIAGDLSQNTASTEIKFKVKNEKVMASAACQDFLHYASESTNTYGLVVLKEGEKQLEFYARGANAENRFKLWSASKTVFSLLLGTEVQKGKIGLDQKLSQFFPSSEHLPDYSDDFRKRIRLRHLWTFSSGIDWCETDSCDTSPALQLYYDFGRDDATKYILSRSVMHNPGTYYTYSSADVTLLSSILKQVHKNQEYQELPQKNLFGPLGIENWVWERDEKGVFLAAADLFMTTGDFAKIGQLLLQKGQWTDSKTGEQKQLFSRDYYKKMTSLSHAIRSEDTPDLVRKSEGPVGGLIWLNEPYPGQLPSLRAAPNNTVYTCGYYGQYLLVFPTAGVVVARNGGDADYFEQLDTFSDKAAKCFAPKEWQEPAGKEKAPELNANVSELIATFKTTLKNNLAARAVAQEICECLFVEEFHDLKTCDALNPQEQFKKLFSSNISIDWEKKSVHVMSKLEDPTHFLLGSPEFSADASYAPETKHDGCRLLPSPTKGN